MGTTDDLHVDLKPPQKKVMSVSLLFVSSSKCIITSCCGCEKTNVHICTEIQQNGGERKRRHTLLAQGYIATIPTHTFLAVEALFMGFYYLEMRKSCSF